MNPMKVPDLLPTPRLLLRGPRPGDTAEFHTAFVESLPALRPWFTWATFTPTLETSAAFVENSHGGFQDRHQLDWFLFLQNTQTFIGVVSLHSAGTMFMDWSRATQLLSYWLRTGYTGHGYMTEAVSVIVDLAFALANINRLEIHCNVANTRSAAVAKRLGFVYQSTVPDGATFDDVYMLEQAQWAMRQTGATQGGAEKQ
ncbi:MAG: GNAT family N-acetyltransferase [Caldilineaceae bacterium]